MLGMLVPEERYGGAGLRQVLTYVLAIEEIATGVSGDGGHHERQQLGLRLADRQSSAPTSSSSAGATRARRRRAVLGGFGLTEPGSGSAMPVPVCVRPLVRDGDRVGAQRREGVDHQRRGGGKVTSSSWR